MHTLKLTKKYEKYPEYKDSGIEWLDKIPANWKLEKIQHLFTKVKRMGFENEQLLSVYRDLGVIIKSSRDDNHNKASDDLSTYQLVEVGDLAINKMKAWQGSVAVSKYRGIVSPAYFICKPISKNNSRFLHYLLRSALYIKQYERNSGGVRNDQWDLSYERFRKIEVVLPVISEQEKIAKYLDEKTSYIDRIIENKQKLIELLREKRAAVINYAVTKGLDPKVELVESGVDWIGKIPSGWEVDKVNHRTLANDGGVWGEDDPAEIGKIVLRSTEINQDGSWDLSSAITRKLTSIEFKKAQLFGGDLLITKSSGSSDHLGKTAIVSKMIEDLECAYSNFMQRLRLNSTFSPKYFFYLINNKIGRDQINYWGSTTSGLVNLNATLIGRFIFPVPSLIEQEKIFNFLDKKTLQHDKAIVEAEKSIEILQEFKSSLISNVVTGKIKV